ncbi:NAD(P)/FAD-dependent oxidoreductase [Mycobacterium sp. CBMA271]|uniref:flavin-containing monooxygenase n=1 Tax=unclassified Mycobacteroides TaxID=2618759 RepID=UPI0012DEFB93|nr:MULTISPECIES: NAD(P)/FAD-dependent oxidoreductase [unclassified Mycobacteroides]MUM17240.1 4-hydroxyacetophenone monooxygenase [Mycobacteroides sp. CBMA 326]MUM23929.1 NAD(P)/FAD-dependent oxidoreductase [Mycobacteroides sp. CBMA 271]
MASDDQDSVAVAVIGAGLSGVATAVKLLEAGITDFVVLERSDRVGGTWRDTTYPGAEVDVPSWLYSLSFAPNPDWSTVNSPAPEILSYIEEIVRRFGLGPHIRFDVNVVQIEFSATDGTWRIESSNGRCLTARAVVAADGLLSDAEVPDIPGIHEFAGQKILSAHWVHDYDFTDKHVAVIGTGASAVQIVPELVKVSGYVTVFQRTAAWVIPRTQFRVPGAVKRTFRRFPVVQRGVRTALFGLYEFLTLGLVWVTPLTRVIETVSKLHLRSQVQDPELRRQLSPQYRIGCKRPLITSEFYPALQRDNSRLVPHAVVEITENGVRTADGSLHPVDCIVFATGYSVGERGSSFIVTGPDGRALGDEWSHGMVGYKSVNVAGYPNLFWTMGPNAFGHSSELLFIEEQVRYAVRCIREMFDRNLRILDIKPEAQSAHNRALQIKLKKTTFSSGCHSWYLSRNGYNGMMFPGSVSAYRRQMSTFNECDYFMISATEVSRVQ